MNKLLLQLTDKKLTISNSKGGPISGGLTSFAKCEDRASQGVDWQGCSKVGVYLKEKDLSGANLQGANFEGANLSGANLNKAILLGAKLEGANLQGATITSAFLTKALVAGIKLKGAILDNTYWVNGKQCKPGSVGECIF
ncbi:MAG: pentapeptide repeat-containing protein [Candidatus Dadabacteria bacterium]|nr:pentapeptide repeat-containing protein [Candidatus Dadabacteria bacterium]NIV41347.1 pentapeptide repeat-containing protein [Candidatus Dadabacteria bacterium]NIX14558.1 pentapeptide repeat-containing protein [Candidatus Dadabacteria bacterium]